MLQSNSMMAEIDDSEQADSTGKHFYILIWVYDLDGDGTYTLPQDMTNESSWLVLGTSGAGLPIIRQLKKQWMPALTKASAPRWLMTIAKTPPA